MEERFQLRFGGENRGGEDRQSQPALVQLTGLGTQWRAETRLELPGVVFEPVAAGEVRVFQTYALDFAPL